MMSHREFQTIQDPFFTFENENIIIPHPGHNPP